jgi:hypothetical protein
MESIMRIINKTFIAGMLAMALVFGMAFASCEQETVTKEVPVAGPPGSTTTKEVHIPVVAADAGMVEAFLTVGIGTGVDRLYIDKPITLNGSYTLGNGKTIVVTNNPPASYNTLTLPEGGALFNISAPTGLAVLTVNGTLTVKGNVTLGSATDSAQSGKLTIDSGAKVFVTSTGTVTATVSSEITLTATSTLSFEGTTAKLNVVGTIDEDETVVGTNTNTAIIVVPDGTLDLTIGTGNVTIGSSAATSTQLGGSFTGTSAAASMPNTAKTALEGSATEVFYSGTESLGTIEVPSEKTLVITGTLNQTAALTVSGDLEIATGAEVTVSGANGKLTVGEDAELTIAEGGTLDLGANATIEGDGTIDNQGTIKTASTAGETLGAILEAATGTIEATGEVVIEDGNVTVQANTDLTLKKVTIEDGTLDLSNLFTPVTVGGSGGLEGGTAQGSATLEGTIEIGTSGTLNVGVSPEVLGNTSAVPPGLNFGDDAGVKVSKGGKITFTVASTEIEYIGTAVASEPATPAAYYQWDSSGGAANDYIEIKENALTLSGKIIANHPPATESDHETIFKNGSTITLKDKWTLNGTLTVENNATLTIEKSAEVARILLIAGTGNVIVGGTIKVEGNSSSLTWIQFLDADSKLTLLPGGMLNVEEYGSLYTGTSNTTPTTSDVRVSVYAVTSGVVGTVAQVVTDEDSGNTAWKLKAGGATGTAAAIADITLGKLKFSTVVDTAVSNVNGGAATPGVAGTLEADTGTAIVFLGAAEAGGG